MVDGNTDPRKNRIEEYRKKVAVRPLETPKQYRSRVGRISRHRYLMNHTLDPARRKMDLESYQEAVERVSAKHQQVLADIEANTPTFREKQIGYDKARGAYESRTFLEETLRMKGIAPAVGIEDMKIQYEKWKRMSYNLPMGLAQVGVGDSETGPGSAAATG
ncbi:hypothetical protein [Candidatus Thalassarchaeum betae]|uniref:hypothetical protein n=1 Tax=Candidatus Thalassarchaeum betae TaxID=2599289 RepID=UPI0030C6DDA6|nr:hypothetical protein [Candidatus Thalassoarchaea betae]